MTVALFLITLFNRQLADKVAIAWEGISPWWAALPVFLLVLWGLLKANYERFQAAEEQLENVRRERSAVAGQLDEILRDGNRVLEEVSRRPYSTGHSPLDFDLRQKVDDWSRNAYAFLNIHRPEMVARFVGESGRFLEANGDTLVAALESGIGDLRELVRNRLEVMGDLAQRLRLPSGLSL